MTVREIANAVGKKPRTVQEWVQRVSAKSASVSAKSASSSPMKPADYTLEEALAIIEEGEGQIKADVYRAIASDSQKPAPGPIKLPNGTQLRELRMIYGPTEAARRLDAWIGFADDIKRDVQIIKVPVTETLGRISPAAYAVEMKERAKKQQRQIEDSSTPDLFR